MKTIARLFLGAVTLASTALWGQTYNYQVVIYGGGLGGAFAALQAKQAAVLQGTQLSVAIFEPTNMTGGQLTASGVGLDNDGLPETGAMGTFLSGLRSYYSAWPVFGTEVRIAQSHLLQQLHAAGVAVYPGKMLATVSAYYQGKITYIGFADGTSAGTANSLYVDASETGEIIHQLCTVLGSDYCRIGNSWNTPGHNLNMDARIQSITWSPVLKNYVASGYPTGLSIGSLGQPDSGYSPATFTSMIQANNNPPPPNSAARNQIPFGFGWEIAYRFSPDTNPASGIVPPPTYDNVPGDPQTRAGFNYSPMNDWSMQAYQLPQIGYQTSANICSGLVRSLEALYFVNSSLGYPWSVANDEGYASNIQCSSSGISSSWNTVLQNYPPIPYYREGWRGIGPYTLTGLDVFRPGAGQPSATDFPTALAVGGFFDDMHDNGDCTSGCRASASDFEPVDQGDFPGTSCLIFDPSYGADNPACSNYGGPFEIPAEALYSAITPNLVFAGKNISQTRIGNSATRVHYTEMRIGSAAGEIAGLAAILGVSPEAVNPYLAQYQIALSGAQVSKSQYTDVPPTDSHWAGVQLVSSHKFINGTPGGQFGISTQVTQGIAAIALTERFSAPLKQPGGHDPGPPHGNGMYCYDAQNTFYYDFTGWMADTGLVSSCPGYFGINTNITREQLAVWLVSSLNWAATHTDMTTNTLSTTYCNSAEFTDVPSDQTYCPAITALQNSGIMVGTPVGSQTSWNPNGQVTRGDLANIIAASIGLAMPASGNPLQLSNTIPGK
jgi:hypothetical protein